MDFGLSLGFWIYFQKTGIFPFLVILFLPQKLGWMHLGRPCLVSAWALGEADWRVWLGLFSVLWAASNGWASVMGSGQMLGTGWKRKDLHMGFTQARRSRRHGPGRRMLAGGPGSGSWVVWTASVGLGWRLNFWAHFLPKISTFFPSFLLFLFFISTIPIYLQNTTLSLKINK